jgi:ABC-type Na+ efflux pump permease subunit
MDIKEFVDSRNSQLSDFQKQYAYLKSEYSTAASAAIQETDPEKQQTLIQRALAVNQELSSQLKDILAVLSKGADSFDSKTLSDLTADLISYQKEFQEMQASSDKLSTLKRIHATNSENLGSVQTMYTVYLGVLIFLCVIVVFLVIRASWTTSVIAATGGAIQRLMPQLWRP